jgi:RNA polymerase sigma-70 factor, ECF subfamily
VKVQTTLTDAEYDDLFRSTYVRLVALALTMSCVRQVAEELAQETMLRAYRHRDTLATMEAPEAWCLRVMSNLLIDHHRRHVAELRAAERVLSQGAVLPTPGTETTDPANLATGARWEDLVSTLTPQQRLVATLYYAADLSVDAVAANTQLSVGTVKSTLSKARHNLQHSLRRPNGDDC